MLTGRHLGQPRLRCVSDRWSMLWTGDQERMPERGHADEGFINRLAEHPIHLASFPRHHRGGFLAGAATNSSALHLRDDGLEFGLVALLLLAPLGLLVGEIVAICSRTWVGAVPLPIAIALGVVVLGPV